MKICFLPIDNRPVCYNLVKDIVAIDDDIELYLPPREFLGDLTKPANVEALFVWLRDLPKADAIILSLDTIAYGGLIPSRRSEESFDEIKSRIENLKNILLEKDAKIYAFSSIMRISNNNYNEEEKEYWSQYGKKIFDYSYQTHKNGVFACESCIQRLIPDEILNDYMQTRKRNFEINKIYLDWQKEGFFELLIFSKDDCAEYGFNVMEALELEKLGGKTKTGADEIPLTLLARAVKKEIRVYVEFTEPEFKDLISNYEDISIEKSVLAQLELAQMSVTESLEDADIVLVVNNFREKQGELVMGWNTQPYSKKLVLPNKSYAIADVRFANGADNNFVDQLLPQIDLEKFYGYSGWNTSANTLGSLLAGIKVKFNAKSFNKKAFCDLQMIRFLDDWAYQANVRGEIETPCEIKELMSKYENILSNTFAYDDITRINYSYPWNRKFEIEVSL